jgi:hypothetical protein
MPDHPLMGQWAISNKQHGSFAALHAQSFQARNQKQIIDF